MYVKRMGFICVLFSVWIAFLGITATCSGAEGPTSCDALLPALRQVRVFQRLDEQQLRKVAEVAELVERQDGDRIIEQGKRIGKMAIALDSGVRIRIGGKTIRVLPANSLVGEIEFLEDVPASADVVLVGKSKIILLEHKRFQGVMDADPGLGYRVMVEIARMEANRLRTTTQGRAK
jgi:CRP-like cAMP-binding protein